MEARIEELEISELEGGPEGLGVEGYVQLLALYMATGETSQIKFLWKRIPSSMKSSSEELGALWAAGQAMWAKDVASFHKAVEAFQWSSSIDPIISKTVENVRTATLRLIGTVYTCVKLETVGNLLGYKDEAALIKGVLEPLGWRVENNFVFPKEPPIHHFHVVSAEDQIAKLTDYVAVLEN